MKKEKILVIGAGGQLGSELVEGLTDRYGEGAVLATDIKVPPGGAKFSNFEVLDVMNRDALHRLVTSFGCTQIYHLAAVLSATGEKNPSFAWQLNMDSLLLVLEAAVDHRVQRVYWPSSIAVFGPGTPRDRTPQETVMDPTTVYGISKLAGERWCAWYHAKRGLDVRSLRYPGLIGYKSLPGGGTTDYAVDIFFKALTEKRYECFLNEDTYLPMMFMDDAVKATIDLMEAPPSKISIRSSYNIGAMSFSPGDIAAEIRRIIPDFQISYKPDFRQAIADSWPSSVDDTRAREDWGWKPQYDLRKMTGHILEKLPGHHLQTSNH